MRMRTGIILSGSLAVLIGGGIVMRADQGETFNAKEVFSKNCLGCHGSKAQKNFNPNLPEGQMIDSILNGIPMDPPPDMPAFSKKGINEERAKALIAYMKSIHPEP